jgi:hypothetical protein
MVESVFVITYQDGRALSIHKDSNNAEKARRDYIELGWYLDRELDIEEFDLNE